MQKHIITCLFLVLTLLACSQKNKKASSQLSVNELENTTWKFEVIEYCTDSIRFLSAEKFLYYFCGTGFIYDGTYTYSGDTIYTVILDDVSHINASKGQSPTCKLDFKYENNKLCVVKKWEEYSMFHHLYRTQCFDVLRR